MIRIKGKANKGKPIANSQWPLAFFHFSFFSLFYLLA